LCPTRDLKDRPRPSARDVGAPFGVLSTTPVGRLRLPTPRLGLPRGGPAVFPEKSPPTREDRRFILPWTSPRLQRITRSPTPGTVGRAWARMAKNQFLSWGSNPYGTTQTPGRSRREEPSSHLRATLGFLTPSATSCPSALPAIFQTGAPLGFTTSGPVQATTGAAAPRRHHAALLSFPTRTTFTSEELKVTQAATSGPYSPAEAADPGRGV